MKATDNDDILIEHIKAVHQWTEKLYQNTTEVRTLEPQLVLQCLEELSTALEELYIAEEEVRLQNEELIVARQAIEAERQRYRELFEFAPDGYLVTDIYGLIQEANRVASQLLNIEQRFLIGKPLINAVPEEHRRAFRAMLIQLHTVNRVEEWEISLSRRRVGLFDAALTVETVRDVNKQAIALRWMLRDITSRKQAEAQLRQVQLENLQLIEADRLKSQFMATVSHELRTPMNAILGFSELLLRGFQRERNAQQINMIERILNNGKQLLMMIEEILDFSKLKANRLELRLDAFDLAELATTTTEELRSLAEQKAIDLQVHLAKSNIPVVNDRMRLRQVLVNLISNAIKFTETGSVTLEIWELPEGRLAIIVSDTGIGIDLADQSRIFQEFWQVDQTSTRKNNGTGLGLAIANALVQLMHGTISVESQLEAGSTFRVELPRRILPH
ncbi:MAG TPA: PAS domain-containing sensor histidine kinase [Cyanobacteria bacterium UBA12227]|nr:PAS domain-containing sensor histidine kinase [Cyanobacteria bacterium UBA12227]HAX85398.1 PAS domain-containing sensor histidine kinase [Cyanobacteria bacterium UBA11370]